MAKKYVWGRIEESQKQTIQGGVYARIDLVLYEGDSGSTPPAPIPENLYTGDTQRITIEYRQTGAYPGPTNIFTTAIRNGSKVQLVAPNTQTYNPVYPKQILKTADGTILYMAFPGKGKDEMMVIKEVSVEEPIQNMATLTIDFTPPNPAPVNGYIVKYKPLGSQTYTTVFPNPTSSPVVITVPGGVAYEGTIKSDCGNNSGSPEFTFLAYASTSVYTAYGATETSICTQGTTGLVYISNNYSDIATGVAVYTNQALTTLLTGPAFIMNSLGLIFNISNGTVGSSTGKVCGA